MICTIGFAAIDAGPGIEMSNGTPSHVQRGFCANGAAGCHIQGGLQALYAVAQGIEKRPAGKPVGRFKYLGTSLNLLQFL